MMDIIVPLVFVVVGIIVLIAAYMGYYLMAYSILPIKD